MCVRLKRKPTKFSRSQSKGGARSGFHVLFARCLFAPFMHPSDFFKSYRKRYCHRPSHRRSGVEIARTSALVSRVEFQGAFFFFFSH